MQEVRDYVHEDMEKILDGRMRGSQAEEIRAMVTSFGNCRPLLEMIIPYVIDRTLSQLLFTLEEHSEFELQIESSQGTKVNAASESDGLAGELFGEGWIRRYSKYPPSRLGS